MQYIPLKQLIQLQQTPKHDACFMISTRESTFTYVEDKERYSGTAKFWAFPTPLCGELSQQYNPYFVMSVLSVTPIKKPLATGELQEIKIPKVLFTTSHSIRRSMTVNAMRMCTELFDTNSERVFELAQNRLQANQTDVVHDLLGYLMHALLDFRHEYNQEMTLRAESIAAYLGLSPEKILFLLRQYEDKTNGLIEAIEQGQAGTMRRKLNISALVNNQLELLSPFHHSALKKEASVIEAIERILSLWKQYSPA